MVVLGQSISVSPFFHQRARIRFPMILHAHVVHVGKSSFSVENVLTDAQHGDVLVSTRRSYSLMNRKTGRSEKMTKEMR